MLESYKKLLSCLPEDSLAASKILKRIGAPRKHSYLRFYLDVTKICFDLSAHKKEEQDFFRIAGLPFPHSLLKTPDPQTLDPQLNLLIRVLKAKKSRRAVTTTALYRNKENKQSWKKVKPVRVLRPEGSSDFLGLYYLSLMCAKQIYPIPVLVTKQEEGVHHYL